MAFSKLTFSDSESGIVKSSQKDRGLMNIGVYGSSIGTEKSGGTETVARELIKRLSDTHQVTLYTGSGPLLDEILNTNINVKTIPYISRSSMPHYLNFLSLSPAVFESVSMYLHAYNRGIFDHIEEYMDVIITFFHLDNVLISRTLETPTLHHFWGAPTIDFQTKLMARAAKPDTLLANSEETAFRLKYWIGTTVAGIVYPGVDLDQFTPNCDPAFDETRTVILYVGRLDPTKGLRELIEAFYRIADTELLYIIGEGPAEQELRKQVYSRGIQESVRFLGSVPHDQIQRYYVACDVFCLPSYYESFGLVNLEAMACGKPVITSRLAATKEYITDNENGLLVSPGEITGLAKGLNRLIHSDTLREKLGSNGRKTAEKYSWDLQATRLEEHLKQTISPKE